MQQALIVVEANFPDAFAIVARHEEVRPAGK
jgi:hypothetical protein